MDFLVVVTGSRYWHYASPILEELRMLPEGTVLMHGDHTGADDMAHACVEFAKNIAKVITVSGPDQNQKMIDCHPDLVLAFHNDLKNSKRTKDCVLRARRAEIKVYPISVGDDPNHELVARRWSEANWAGVHDRSYDDQWSTTSNQPEQG
jgi:hypothetical protein